jgi:thymidylate kinase
MPEYIYICGPDGSGKSTYLYEIQKHLNKANVKTKYVWLRSPKILSKPLMAYCRLTGLTKYFHVKEIRYGGHEFYRSKAISYLFPLVQLIDFKIKNFFLKSRLNKSEYILIDRFSLDTLADLMVDTHRFNLHNTWIGRSFINSIPEGTEIIVLDVNEENIRSRKRDVRFDPHLKKKIRAYKILGDELNLRVVNNNRDKEIVLKDILGRLKLNERH